MRTWAAYWTTGRLRDKFWFCTIANVCTQTAWWKVLWQPILPFLLPNVLFRTISYAWTVLVIHSSHLLGPLLKRLLSMHPSSCKHMLSVSVRSSLQPGTAWVAPLQCLALGSVCQSECQWQSQCDTNHGCNTFRGTEPIPRLCAETGDINTAKCEASKQCNPK